MSDTDSTTERHVSQTTERQTSPALLGPPGGVPVVGSPRSDTAEADATPDPPPTTLQCTAVPPDGKNEF